MKKRILENINKYKITYLTILSGIIGTVVFIIIYGTEVLNVTKDRMAFW